MVTRRSRDIPIKSPITSGKFQTVFGPGTGGGGAIAPTPTPTPKIGTKEFFDLPQDEQRSIIASTEQGRQLQQAVDSGEAFVVDPQTGNVVFAGTERFTEISTQPEVETVEPTVEDIIIGREIERAGFDPRTGEVLPLGEGPISQKSIIQELETRKQVQGALLQRGILTRPEQFDFLAEAERQATGVPELQVRGILEAERLGIPQETAQALFAPSPTGPFDPSRLVGIERTKEILFGPPDLPFVGKVPELAGGALALTFLGGGIAGKVFGKVVFKTALKSPIAAKGLLGGFGIIGVKETGEEVFALAKEPDVGRATSLGVGILSFQKGAKKPLQKTLTLFDIRKAQTILAKPEQIKFKETFKAIEEFKGEIPVTPTKISTVEGIPARAATIIQNVIAQREDVVFGSAVSKVRPPKDIDIASKNPQKSAALLASRLREAGFKVEFKPKKDKLFIVTKDRRIKVEFKPLERLEQFPFTEKIVTEPTGLKRITETEQAKRKLIGTLFRPKDIPDVPKILTRFEKITAPEVIAEISFRPTPLRPRRPFGIAKPITPIERISPLIESGRRLRVIEEPSLLRGRQPSIIPVVRPSIIPPARPSVIPPARPSVIPPSRPSVIPPSRPSVIPPSRPSLIPPTTPSLIPPTTPSVIPPSTPSIITPQVPSVIPPTTPSLIPPSRPSVLPTTPIITVSPRRPPPAKVRPILPDRERVRDKPGGSFKVTFLGKRGLQKQNVNRFKSREEANRFGGYVTDVGPNVGFKVTQTKDKPKAVKLSSKIFGFGKRQNKFTKQGAFFVEKKKNRTDSVGERTPGPISIKGGVGFKQIGKKNIRLLSKKFGKGKR